MRGKAPTALPLEGALSPNSKILYEGEGSNGFAAGGGAEPQ